MAVSKRGCHLTVSPRAAGSRDSCAIAGGFLRLGSAGWCAKMCLAMADTRRISFNLAGPINDAKDLDCVWSTVGSHRCGDGAYHAHGLEKTLYGGAIWQPEKLQRDMQNFDVGVRYEIYHALAMVLAGLLAWRAPSRWFQAAGLLFLIGTALFSGGLYYPVLTQTKLPWYLVPAGGMSLILAWLLLALGALSSRPGEPVGR